MLQQPGSAGPRTKVQKWLWHHPLCPEGPTSDVLSPGPSTLQSAGQEVSLPEQGPLLPADTIKMPSKQKQRPWHRPWAPPASEPTGKEGRYGAGRVTDPDLKETLDSYPTVEGGSRCLDHRRSRRVRQPLPGRTAHDPDPGAGEGWVTPPDKEPRPAKGSPEGRETMEWAGDVRHSSDQL